MQSYSSNETNVPHWLCVPYIHRSLSPKLINVYAHFMIESTIMRNCCRRRQSVNQFYFRRRRCCLFVARHWLWLAEPTAIWLVGTEISHFKILPILYYIVCTLKLLAPCSKLNAKSYAVSLGLIPGRYRRLLTKCTPHPTNKQTSDKDHRLTLIISFSQWHDLLLLHNKCTAPEGPS